MSAFDRTTLERHGLSDEEYARIVTMLGREPSLTELGIFSVMWSEHCSYKSSRVHLRRLPTTGARVLQGPGENAGAVDIGEGLAAVSKSSRTTIRRSSSRIKEPRLASAASSETSLRWARDRSRC